MSTNCRNIYTVRFWNVANECINVGGKYIHDFESYEDAWNGANALLRCAYDCGAIEADINNEFFSIVNDDDEGR